MKTPSKDYISALKNNSYGSRTPLTSTSLSPSQSALGNYKLPDIQLFASNQLMTALQSQNVRLMQKLLDFMNQRSKIRQHCQIGIKQFSIFMIMKINKITINKILAGMDDVIDKSNEQAQKYKYQMQKHQKLIEQIKSIILSYNILQNSKEKVIEKQIIYPQLLRQDLEEISTKFEQIQDQIVNGVKRQISKITKLFKTNKTIGQIDTDGPFSSQLQYLIEILTNIIKSQTKTFSQPNKSVNTSMQKITNNWNKQKNNSFQKLGVQQDLYRIILSQAQGLEYLLRQQSQDRNS